MGGGGIVCLLALTVPAGGLAATADATACTKAGAVVEHEAGLPPRLLNAIGLVETGRVDAAGHSFAPWPWSVNADGAGHFYDSKPAAVAAVAALQAAGTKSIDVGCMQINLQYHPFAFASLDQAFDPMANTRYAARFLQALYRQSGSWPQAAADYHSQTPGIGEPYRDQVLALWPSAGRYGAAMTMARAGSAVDPYHVLTDSFRAQLQAAAAFRARRDAAMFAAPVASAHPRRRGAALADAAGMIDAAR